MKLILSLLITPALSRLLQTKCPFLPPQSDSSCSNEGMYCSWGSDPRFECRTQAQCFKDSTGGLYWKLSAGTCGSESQAALPYDGVCSTLTEGEICQVDGALCPYDDGSYCVCTNANPYPCYPVCTITVDSKWQCIPPMNNDPACPLNPPNAGSSCSGSMSCSYTCEHKLNCVNGEWKYSQGYCPKCAAPNTLITTLNGSAEISDLKVGDLVLSVDNGEQKMVPIMQVSKYPVYNHHVVKVVLENDSIILMSPGHPTADGRTFNDLKSGDYLHNHKILSAEIISYPYDHTYDILPQSDTGYYFAENVLIGSTLFSATSQTFA